MKRSGRDDSWAKTRKKRARLEGKEYTYTTTDETGEKVIKRKNAVVMGPTCESKKCKNARPTKCEISEEDRQVIHESFWSLSTWPERKVYVLNNIERCVGQGKTRTKNRYYLADVRNKKIPVCRTTFLNTLSIGAKMVKTWIKSDAKKKEAPERKTKKKKSEDAFHLKSFLGSVEKQPSHYCRSTSNKTYVAEKFTSLREVYDKYREFCSELDSVPCCRRKFEMFFYSCNLSLFVPKKDLCNKCVSFNNGTLPQSDYDNHMTRKEEAKKEKMKDKAKAKRGEISMLTLDAQATKHCPQTSANVMYFHLKLNVHNNTVFDVATKECQNYFYTELDAPSTASTFISCICDYIKSRLSKLKKPIIIYCDNCSAQNKNSMLSNALLSLASELGVDITIKYLEVGHTFLECDSVHSVLERQFKNRNLYLPQDFVRISREARQVPFPYDAQLLTSKFFHDYSIKEAQFYTSIRPQKNTKTKIHPKVTDLVAIKHQPCGNIEYKLRHTEEWTSLATKAKSKPRKMVYPKLVKSPIKLDVKKYNHLQIIKKTLPRFSHKFYDSLPFEDKKS
jgi:hypothetical protein